MITPISSWRKSVFVAKRLAPTRDSTGNQMYPYDTPIAYVMNVQPMTAEAIVEVFGGNKKEMFISVVVNQNYDIDEFDKVYLEDDTIVGETFNGENAHFIVRRVSKQNIVTIYYFESIKG